MLKNYELYTEYASYDYAINETETENNILCAFKANIKNFSVLPYSLSSIKNLEMFKDQNISVGCPIDFPYGLSDLKSRNFMVSQAIKSGANVVDLVIPSKVITNRKYDKFREDIKNNFDTCFEKNVKLRYILEYRIFNHEILAKVCQILMSLGIDTVLPSSGMMIDDINDNIIACNYFLTKTGINVICNGNFFTQNHIKVIKKSNLYGLRIHHLRGVDILQ